MKRYGDKVCLIYFICAVITGVGSVLVITLAPWRWDYAMVLLFATPILLEAGFSRRRLLRKDRVSGPEQP